MVKSSLRLVPISEGLIEPFHPIVQAFISDAYRPNINRGIVSYVEGLRMSNHAIEEAYKALKNGEPQTPNEIAVVIGMNQKTVQMALMELVSTKPDVKWKKIGRYRLFWKEKPKEKSRLD